MVIKRTEWVRETAPILYPKAVETMERRVEAILDGSAAEMVWLLEHPPIYTAGTGAVEADMLSPHRFPVYQSGRGGKYTYHGPGQRVAYVMSDLRTRGQDLRAHVWRLEELVIMTLLGFGIRGERRDGRVGIWVSSPEGAEKKIAAIGVRARKWVTYHGFSINVDPDLEHFSGIVPCGIAEYGVTSMKEMGSTTSMPELDAALERNWSEVFG